MHLVLCTRTLGPLNDNNCFPFEELNRKVTRFIKSQDLVGDEFLKFPLSPKFFFSKTGQSGHWLIMTRLVTRASTPKMKMPNFKD